MKLEQDARTGFFFRVTRANEQALRTAKQFTTLETQKSGVKFTHAALTAATKEYQEQHTLYATEQETIVREIAGIARGYCEVMEQYNALSARLDVLVSFAQVAAAAPIPFVRPVVRPMGTVFDARACVCVWPRKARWFAR